MKMTFDQAISNFHFDVIVNKDVNMKNKAVAFSWWVSN